MFQDGKISIKSAYRQFGKQIYKQDYKTQTASLEGIIASFSTGYSEFITEINSDVWFNFLVDAQTDFETTLRKHNANKVEDLEVESVTESRPPLVKSLRKLFDFLPMQYELTEDQDLGNIIAQLKMEVDRF